MILEKRGMLSKVLRLWVEIALMLQQSVGVLTC